MWSHPLLHGSRYKEQTLHFPSVHHHTHSLRLMKAVSSAPVRSLRDKSSSAQSWRACSGPHYCFHHCLLLFLEPRWLSIAGGFGHVATRVKAILRSSLARLTSLWIFLLEAARQSSQVESDQTSVVICLSWAPTRWHLTTPLIPFLAEERKSIPFLLKWETLKSY